MKATIEIHMDNAAFEPDNGTELANVLRRLADKVDGVSWRDGCKFSSFDSNGNRVGQTEITKD